MIKALIQAVKEKLSKPRPGEKTKEISYTVIGKGHAKDVAARVNPRAIERGVKLGQLFDHTFHMNLNQRQKRKRARAANRKVA
jgi:hypothetical protein